MPFCTTKTWSFQVTHDFLWRNCRSPKMFLLVFLLGFYFFHCRSFSPCWPLAFLIFSPPQWNFHVFLPTKFDAFFLIARASSFSVIHVSVDIKNNFEKYSALFLFFLSKSPGGHAISRRNTSSCLWYHTLNWVILHWYTCGADGRRVGRAYSHVITKISRMDYQSFLGMGRSRALTLHPSMELRYH